MGSPNPRPGIAALKAGVTRIETVTGKTRSQVFLVGPTELTPRRIDELIADGTISGGMIPKIAGALDAANSGVKAVHIIDGRVPHAMLLEVLTEQAFGTMIRSH